VRYSALNNGSKYVLHDITEININRGERFIILIDGAQRESYTKITRGWI